MPWENAYQLTTYVSVKINSRGLLRPFNFLIPVGKHEAPSSGIAVQTVETVDEILRAGLRFS